MKPQLSNPTAYRRYRAMLNTARWRAVRAAALAAADYICADCHAFGIITAATEVHHIVPVGAACAEGEAERRMYDPANLVALCARCHRERHRALRREGFRAIRRGQAAADADAANRLFGTDDRTATGGAVFSDRGEGVKTQTPPRVCAPPSAKFENAKS